MPDLGGFFAVELRTDDPGTPWLPMRAVLETPKLLAARVGRVRASLAMMGGIEPGAVEYRVAVSVVHLGFLARPVSVWLAGTAGAGPQVALGLDSMWWQDTLGGPYPLSARPATGVVDDDPVRAVFAPLTEAFGRLGDISAKVLWGNVASALNSAATQIQRSLPGAGPRAWAAIRDAGQAPELAVEARGFGPGFTRSSCCLIYRLNPEGASYCGDCVLA